MRHRFTKSFTILACVLLSSAKAAHANGGISAPDAVTGTKQVVGWFPQEISCRAGSIPAMV